MVQLRYPQLNGLPLTRAGRRQYTAPIGSRDPNGKQDTRSRNASHRRAVELSELLAFDILLGRWIKNKLQDLDVVFFELFKHILG